MDVRSVASDPVRVAFVARADDPVAAESTDLAEALHRCEALERDVVVERCGPDWRPGGATGAGAAETTDGDAADAAGTGATDGTLDVDDTDAAADVDDTDAAAGADVLDRIGVDCVVLGALDLADAVGVARSVRSGDPDCPVIAYPVEAAAEVAAELTTAGVGRYLARDLGYGPDDLAGEVASAVATADDRRQHRYERSLFRAVMENAPKSIYLKDREGRHVAISDGVEAAVDERMIDKTDLDLYADEIGEEDARAALEDDVSVAESGEPIVGKEERNVRDDGEVMWLRTTKLPWRRDGEPVGLVGFTRIVTEQKAREAELERQTQRLEQFASFASHDLRNPVNIAKGYLDLAMESDDEALLEKVADALDRMDRLIDDLLHMASPAEDERIDEWVAFPELVRRTWTAVDTHEATLALEVPDDLELLAHSGGLRQLLSNVFTNAIDHGGPDVAVEVGLTDTGFYVADDGPGIDPEDRADVFEYGQTTGGTGVGLVIAREIAVAHGWEVSVRESDAGGARFEFDRCVRRRAADRALVEGDPVSLGDRTDVGDPTPPGTATDHGDGSWTLAAGGRNLWGDVEEYYAVHTTVEGPVRVEATVSDLEWVHEYSKAGVVLADGFDEGSPFGFVGAVAAGTPEVLWRSRAGEDVSVRGFEVPDSLPLRVRIDRVGDTVTCWTAAEGADWTPAAQWTVSLSEPVGVGLLVCGHNERHRCEAAFDDVRVVPLESPDGAGE